MRARESEIDRNIGRQEKRQRDGGSERQRERIRKSKKSS